METTIDTSQKALAASTAGSLALKTTSETDSDKTTETTSTADEFTDLILKALNKTAEQNVSEEELFAGLIKQRLNAKDEALGEAFQSELTKLKSSMARSDGYIPVEACANQALKNLVEADKITKEDAEKIKGEAFLAAQIDDNKEMLYDDRGSAGDPTIAVSKMEAALLSMRTLIEKIDNGELTVESRSLDEAATGSASGSSTSGSTSTPSGDPASAPTGAQSMDGAGGFVWKPVSESNGKLAVLLPEEFSGVVDRIEIHSELPPTDATKLASANYTKDYSDGRPLFRLDKSGGEYGDNIHVVAYKTDGTTATWDINDGSVRAD